MNHSRIMQRLSHTLLVSDTSLSRITRLALSTLGILAMNMLAPQAHADIVYSNLSSGFNSSSHAIQNTLPFDYQSIACSFTPSASYTLSSFEVGATHITNENLYKFSIVKDNAGTPTGSNIMQLSGVVLTGPPINTLYSFPASGVLQSGTKYWLIMEGGGVNTLGGWAYNTTGSTGLMLNNGLTWSNIASSPTAAFRINGNTAAPEPCTLAFFALGGVGAIIKKRRQTK
jgi:hypothetical protein